MEGVRLDDCTLIHYLERGLEKAAEYLVEAAERTPATITSKRLVEDAHRLLLGLTRIVEELSERNECRARHP